MVNTPVLSPFPPRTHTHISTLRVQCMVRALLFSSRRRQCCTCDMDWGKSQIVSFLMGTWCNCRMTIFRINMFYIFLHTQCMCSLISLYWTIVYSLISPTICLQEVSEWSATHMNTSKLVDVEHCGGEPEQANTGMLSLMSDVTHQVKHPPSCTIHSPG